MSRFARERPYLLVGLLLALATLAPYWRVFGNGFINFDDGEYVTDNPHVLAGLTVRGVLWAFTTTHAYNWHPLTWLSLMLDSRVFGYGPFGFHFTNLLLHLASALLLFALLNRMTTRVWPSAFVAALFAVHPLHVESVAWIAERKDVLSTFLWMLTMLAYVWYVERPKASRYSLVLLLYALGLLAKPMLVTLPFVLLLLDWWPLGRVISASRPARKKTKGSNWTGWRLIWEKSPLFALSAASSVSTFLVQRNIGLVTSLDQLPLGLRLGNALVSYVTYIGKMLWPRNLAIFYPHPREALPIWLALAAGLAILCVTILVIRAGRARPYLAVGWLWYLVTLVPVIGLVQVGWQALADRYTYVPLIGLFIIIAWGIPDFLTRRAQVAERGHSRKREQPVGGAAPSSAGFLAAPACAALLALMVCTWVQVGYWKNSIVLFTHALAVTRDNYIAHFNLGLALAKQKKIDSALREYYETLRIKPDYAQAHNNLGNLLSAQGKTDQAIAHYYEAVRLSPGLAEAHLNLGNCLAKQGRAEEAIEQYKAALPAGGDGAGLHLTLGTALAAQGKTADAIEQFLDALRTNPNNVDAQYNLGLALAAEGRLDDAITHYRTALELKPDYPEAHNNLGVALSEQGRMGEAISHYKSAILSRPDYAEAHGNLGNALARQGDTDGAIRELREAIRLKPDVARTHSNLAIVLYLKGRYREAWREIHAAQRYGYASDPDVLAALSRKMPEPRE